MKYLERAIFLAAVIGAVAGCKPGPITLGGGPTTTVADTQGNMHYVSTYHVDKSWRIAVPAGLKGAELTTYKIRAAYAQDPVLNPYHIEVITKHGVVTLSGQVPNNDIKSYAIKVARYMKGVLAVNAKNLIVTNR